MRRNPALVVALVAAGLAASPALEAQEGPPDSSAPAAEPAKREPTVYRPIEGPVIINLRSVDVPREGTLGLLFAHRFSTPVQDSDFNNLFSFDSFANVGIGLDFAPLKQLDIFFYRYSNDNKTYEFGAKYGLLSGGPFGISLSAGGDVRTAPELEHRSTMFAQAILAYTFAPWCRVTAVPTYLNKTSGQDGYITGNSDPGPLVVVQPEPTYTNVFNVPLAASIALTRSITIHGEVVPSYHRTVLVTRALPPCDPAACPTIPTRSSPGVGWIVSLEKTLPRHRFAFTAGNLRETTVDQYPLANFGGSPRNIYLGFYFSRQWKVN